MDKRARKRGIVHCSYAKAANGYPAYQTLAAWMKPLHGHGRNATVGKTYASGYHNANAQYHRKGRGKKRRRRYSRTDKEHTYLYNPTRPYAVLYDSCGQKGDSPHDNSYRVRSVSLAVGPAPVGNYGFFEYAPCV